MVFFGKSCVMGARSCSVQVPIDRASWKTWSTWWCLLSQRTDQRSRRFFCILMCRNTPKDATIRLSVWRSQHLWLTRLSSKERIFAMRRIRIQTYHRCSIRRLSSESRSLATYKWFHQCKMLIKSLLRQRNSHRIHGSPTWHQLSRRPRRSKMQRSSSLHRHSIKRFKDKKRSKVVARSPITWTNPRRSQRWSQKWHMKSKFSHLESRWTSATRSTSSSVTSKELLSASLVDMAVNHRLIVLKSLMKGTTCLTLIKKWLMCSNHSARSVGLTHSNWLTRAAQPTSGRQSTSTLSTIL